MNARLEFSFRCSLCDVFDGFRKQRATVLCVLTDSQDRCVPWLPSLNGKKQQWSLSHQCVWHLSFVHSGSVCLFSLLCTIPLHGWTMSVITHNWGFMVASTFWLLGTSFQCLWGGLFSALWGPHGEAFRCLWGPRLGMELWDHFI